jgi:hypothetical protein
LLCNKDIKGGDVNLMHHENGAKHLRKLAIADKREAEKQSRNAPGSIMKFFGASTRPTASAQPSASSSQIASDADLPSDDEIQASGPVQTLKSQSKFQPDRQPDLEIIEVPAPSALLISRLRNLAANLPASVPLGSENEPLSCFATSPVDSIPPGEDAWESVINPTLDRVIGFGKSTPEIASFIRRGPLGMDGFCNWITACIEDLGISTDILEGRLERVMQAMINRCVNQ